MKSVHLGIESYLNLNIEKRAFGNCELLLFKQWKVCIWELRAAFIYTMKSVHLGIESYLNLSIEKRAFGNCELLYLNNEKCAFGRRELL